jgi:CheY-like chemotaxis protein
MLLRYEGYEVWTAPSGKQALARIEREAPGRRGRSRLTDVKMPDMDGSALLEKVRERPIRRPW